jgi:hypothetical protein
MRYHTFPACAGHKLALVVDERLGARDAHRPNGTATVTSRSVRVHFTSMTSQTSARVGRNDPCPCGSGRKYKQCCLAKDEAAAAIARAKAAEEVAAPAPEAEPVATTASTRAPKPHTDQPWRATTTRGFVPRSRTPHKVGGS